MVILQPSMRLVDGKFKTYTVGITPVTGIVTVGTYI